MKIKYPQVPSIFYKESNSCDRRCAWANYDDQGNFINVTDFYRQILFLQNGNKVYIEGKAWILHDHLNKLYRGT